MARNHPDRPMARPRKRYAALQGYRGWKLQDAKARFSDLVRLAKHEGPQRVTMHGDDAVVVVSAEAFAAMVAPPRPSLHALLSNSPLRALEFGSEGERSPVHEPEL